MIPPCTSSQLTTLKVGSRIHIQATVDSAVGTMNGSSRNARARLRPRKLWLMTRAMPRPPASFSTVVTHTYMKVLRVTCQNTASCSSVWKLARPTNTPSLATRRSSRLRKMP